MSDSLNLPISWLPSRICDVSIVNPKFDKSLLPDDLEVSFVPMPAVGACNGRIDVNDVRQFGAMKKGYTPFFEGDVLFAKITPCMENGKMAVVPMLRNGLGFGSTEFHVLRTFGGMSAAYLYYFISSARFRNDAEHNMTGAVGQRRVPVNYLSEHSLPVPPGNEQRRIVAKIEELFSELDKGVESLTAAREQLKVYRQAVLKHAFEGKLTADWRKGHPSGREELAHRLRQAELSRQQAWDDSPNTFRKGQYQAPVPCDVQDPPKVPDEWALVSMDALTFHITSGSRAWSQFYDRGDATFVMAQNIRPGNYSSGFNQKVAPPSGSETERTRVAPNDLLITIVGANTGNLCKFDIPSSSHYVCQSVALMRPVNSKYARFFELYFQSESGGLRQYKRYIYGAGRPHLGFDQLRRTIVPLPNLREAELLVERIERCFDQIQILDHHLATELSRVNSLRQSVLKNAFSGQLIPQDPKDEPASVLLERIRAEKKETGIPKRAKKPDTKKVK